MVAQTRITVPPVPPNRLSRPRMHRLLEGLCRQPLGLVLGGAGFGKTSALAAWAGQREGCTAWYSVAEEDRDLYTVVGHLLGALYKARPQPTLEEARQRLERDGVDGNRWRPVIDHAINAVAQGEPVVLVIDDSHRLRSERVLEALTYLGNYLPANLCLVLGSRHPPDFPAWQSWMVQGRVELVEPVQLAMSRDEIEALFELRRASPPGFSEVRDVSRRTGGWPLGVDFLARSASGVRLPQTGALDAYIANEIWAGRSPEDKDFLLRCSVLELLTAEACRTITGRSDAEQRLLSMAAEGLFMRALPDGRYTVHQLFRDFLKTRLEGDSEQFRRCHAGAARALLDLGQPVEAVLHLVKARKTATAGEILIQEAPRLLELGRQERVLELLELVEPLLEETGPELLLARGQALRQRNAFEPALQAFERAAGLARAVSDARLEARATLGSARVFVDTVQPARAAELLRRAFRLTPEHNREERSQILRLLAENSVNQGRARAALRFRRWAQRLLDRPTGDILDARLLLRTGQIHAARAHLLGRLESRDDRVDRVMEAHREDVLVLAYVAAAEGDYELASWAARSGLNLGIAGASAFTEAVAWMRLGHAQQLDPEAGFEEAVASYTRAGELVKKTGVQRLQAEMLMGLALLHASVGNVPSSYNCATDGLDIIRSSGDAWLSAYLRLATGIAALRGGHPDPRGLLADARHQMEQCQDPFGSCVAGLWLALSAEPAVRSGALKIAQRRILDRGYGFLLERPTLFGPRERVSVPEETESEPELYVQSLGPLRIWRKGEEVPARAWKRKKARELFAMLVHQRGYRVQKEYLMGLLWPEASAQAANRDFRVALHSASSALEPDRPKNTPDRYIERWESAYEFQTGDQVRVDADDFHRLADMGTKIHDSDPEEAAQLWSRALGLYHGDYLEEYVYTEWCATERDRLRSLFLNVAGRLAQHYLEHDQTDDALATCHLILERDRCWEEAYRILMEIHLAQDRTFLAARTYEQCCQVLEEELGVTPSEEIEALYHRCS